MIIMYFLSLLLVNLAAIALIFAILGKILKNWSFKETFIEIFMFPFRLLLIHKANAIFIIILLFLLIVDLTGGF